MRPPNTPRPSTDSLEALYLEFVGAEGDQLDFEGFVERHPEKREELARLHAAWTRLETACARADSRAERPPDLGQRYSVEREIARGGMGVVYGLWDGRLRRRLAVKVGRRDAGAGSSTKLGAHRFLEEAQVTAQLDHPGIVPVHDVGFHDGRTWFTMRRVEGCTLAEVIERVAANDPDWTRTRALGVLVRVCETIAFAHSRGVVHRDLKPSNVMVGRFGEVYVMDWGLAKVLDAEKVRIAGKEPNIERVSSDRREALDDSSDSGLATLAGAVVGTPFYMAPEQALGHIEDIGPEADVHALGAILYHLMAGQRPYADVASTANQFLEAVRAAPPTPIEQAARDVPAELAAICNRAMATRRRDRYPTAEDLRDDLRAYLEGRVVRAHSTGAVAELRKWIDRNRSLAAALAAALLSLAVTLGLQLDRNRKLQAANVKTSAAEQLAQDQRDVALARLEESRFQNYVANVSATLLSVERGDAASGWQQLEAVAEDERNFEWYHLWSRLDASQRAIALPSIGHAIEVTRDAGLLAVLTHPRDPGTILLIEGSSGHVLHEIVGSRGQPWSIEFTPREDRLLVGCEGGWIQELSLAGEVLREYREPSMGAPLLIETDPSGTWAACPSAEVLLVIELATLTPVARFELSRAGGWRAAWSPNGRRLAAQTRDGTVTVWKAPEWTELSRFDSFAGSGTATGDVSPITFSADGSLVVTAGYANAEIGVFRADDGEHVRFMFGHRAKPRDFVLIPEFNHLLSTSQDGQLALFDLNRLELVHTLPGHRTYPSQMARVSGERFPFVVSTGWDQAVRFWFPDGAESPLILDEHRGRINSIDFSADGQHFLTAAWDGTVRLWDASRLRCLETWSKGSPGTVAAAFGRSIDEIYYIADGHLTRTDAKGTIHRRVRCDPGGRLSVSDDGQWIVATGRLGIALFDSELRLYRERREAASRSAFVDDDKLLVRLDEAGGAVLTLLDLPALELANRLEDGPFQMEIRDVDVSPDGRWWVSTGPSPPGDPDAMASFAKVWDASDESFVRDLKVYSPSVAGLCFSPDGSRLAVMDRHAITLWDVERWERVATLEGHTGQVRAIAFSPDGRYLISGGDDTTLRIWGTVPARERGADFYLARYLRRRVQPLVERLFAEFELPELVADALRGRNDLDADELATALEQVRAWPISARDYQEFARDRTLEPDRSVAEYGEALMAAEAGAALEPGAPLAEVDRGLALYRLQRFRAAAEAWAAARNRYEVRSEDPWPALELLEGMTWLRLGRDEQGAALLRASRSQLEGAAVAEEVQTLLREARAAFPAAFE